MDRTLVDAFRGYTHFPQKSEGAWRVGGVTFREAVTILRMLDDGSTRFDMSAGKGLLAQELQQASVLIV